MTKTALNKIVLALGCLALFVIGALMIQELTIKEASADVEKSQSEARSTEASHKEIVASFLSDGNDVDPSTLTSACFNLQLNASISPEFTQEALDPSDFEECYASGNSLSFTYFGNSEAARSFCEEKLRGKGWIKQEGNSDLVASYAKPRGAYTWLVLQFIDMGERTVVLATTVDTSDEGEALESDEPQSRESSGGISHE